MKRNAASKSVKKFITVKDIQQGECFMFTQDGYEKNSVWMKTSQGVVNMDNGAYANNSHDLIQCVPIKTSYTIED